MKGLRKLKAKWAASGEGEDGAKYYEEIQKLKKDLETLETFYSKINKLLAKIVDSSEAMIGDEREFFDTMRSGGGVLLEFGEDEPEIDVKFRKMIEVVSATGNMLLRLDLDETHYLNDSFIEPFQNFRDFDIKLARKQIVSYDNIIKAHSSAVERVKIIKTSKKVHLPKLQEAENERDVLRNQLEEIETSTLDIFSTMILERKYDTLERFAHLLISKYEYHKKRMQTLENSISQVNEILDVLKDLKEAALTESQSETAFISTVQDEASEIIPGSLASVPELVDEYSERYSWEFIIFKSGKSGTLKADFKNGTLILFGTPFPIKDLTTVTLVKTKHLKFIWKTRKEDKITFESTSLRQQFYEVYNFMLNGMQRPVIDNELSLKETIKVWCGTWNMGDAPPNWYDDPLEEWMPKGQDIYAIATQECQYTPRPGYSSTEDDFMGWIGDHLGEKYMKLAGTSLMSIRIGVFINREHYYKISNLRYTTVATGIANIIGNKGASVVAFCIYDTSFCFLGSHLAARIDQNRLQVRNQNYRDILSRLPFSEHSDCHNTFDHFFWMGDLNYRIEWGRDEIIKAAEEENWDELRKYDQLVQQKSLGNCFLEFEETEPSFIPTYRFNRGDRTWSAEKMREPAWCDRVLWKSIYPQNVRQTAFAPAHGLMTSDHSPVYTLFDVDVPYPSLPHTREACTIVISNLRGYDIVTSEESEPNITIIFQSHFLIKDGLLPPKGTGSNPAWLDSDLPPLYPYITDQDYLEQCWIYVLVRDRKDLRTSTIGTTVIRLKGACDGGPCSFSGVIADKGRVYGRLEGDVQIIYSTSKIDGRVQRDRGSIYNMAPIKPDVAEDEFIITEPKKLSQSTKVSPSGGWNRVELGGQRKRPNNLLLGRNNSSGSRGVRSKTPDTADEIEVVQVQTSKETPQSMEVTNEPNEEEVIAMYLNDDGEGTVINISDEFFEQLGMDFSGFDFIDDEKPQTETDLPDVDTILDLSDLISPFTQTD